MFGRDVFAGLFVLSLELPCTPQLAFCAVDLDMIVTKSDSGTRAMDSVVSIRAVIGRWNSNSTQSGGQHEQRWIFTAARNNRGYQSTATSIANPAVLGTTIRMWFMVQGRHFELLQSTALSSIPNMAHEALLARLGIRSQCFATRVSVFSIVCNSKI